MAVNASKKHSRQAWQKWLESGAVSGVRVTHHGGCFSTLTFTQRRTVGETLALAKKCGYRGATAEELNYLLENPSIPKTKVPEIDWIGNRWNSRYVPSLIGF